MPGRLSRHDSYGRPLPHLAEAPSRDVSERTTNARQREHILYRVRAILEEHYPYLLREDVSAEVMVSFRVQRGIIQNDVYVEIRRHYRAEEE